jgi:hypothetical protein
MNAPYSNISKIANATGSILGISKNLLGGSDAIIESISPGGLLGDLERLIQSGNITEAFWKLTQVRNMVVSINIHVKEIN